MEHILGREIFEKDDVAVDMRELARAKLLKQNRARRPGAPARCPGRRLRVDRSGFRHAGRHSARSILPFAYWVDNLSPFSSILGQFGLRWYGLAYVLGFLARRLAALALFPRRPLAAAGRPDRRPDDRHRLRRAARRTARLFPPLRSSALLRTIPRAFPRLGGRHGQPRRDSSACWWRSGGMRADTGALPPPRRPARDRPRPRACSSAASPISSTANSGARSPTCPGPSFFPRARRTARRSRRSRRAIPRNSTRPALEGALLLAFMQWRFWRSDVVRTQPGRLSGEFLLAYAVVRSDRRDLPRARRVAHPRPQPRHVLLDLPGGRGRGPDGLGLPAARAGLKRAPAIQPAVSGWNSGFRRMNSAT